MYISAYKGFIGFTCKSTNSYADAPDPEIKLIPEKEEMPIVPVIAFPSSNTIILAPNPGAIFVQRIPLASLVKNQPNCPACPSTS